MGLSPFDIATIVEALQESDWDEAVVVVGDARIAVARNGGRVGAVDTAAAAAAPAAAAPAVVAAPATEQEVARAPESAAAGVEVHSPSVGVFWSSPEPGAAAFVSVGDRVEAGDVLCIVEIMKLMTNVHAQISGIVEAVLVSNGDNVEFGTPLFRVRED